jgi:hypothetical protein
MGYRLIKLHEVWHFDRWSCGAQGGLFGGYIDAWLKKKQEASGYPSSVRTDAQKEAYKKDFFDHENIQLDNVEKNGPMRTMAKLFLNSFWDK